MPRAVNTLAYVNATFSMTVDSNNGFTVTSSPSLVFGGIDTHSVSTVNVGLSYFSLLGIPVRKF